MKGKTTPQIQNQVFIIQAKDFTLQVDAKDKDEAITHFFHTILKENRLDQVGMVGIVKGKTEDEDVAFRIAPALYYLGILDREELEMNLERFVGSKFDDGDIDRMIENDKKWVEGLKK